MFCDYEYRLDGVVDVCGQVQVEFRFLSGRRLVGIQISTDDEAEIITVQADSMRIVDGKGQVIYEAVLIGTQPEAVGAMVCREKEAEIKAACVEAGREQYSYTRADYEADRADMAHSDGERN